MLTRYNDTYLSLEARTALANTLNADLFISIHCNASPDWAHRGLETYYLSKACSLRAMEVAGTLYWRLIFRGVSWTMSLS